MTEQGHGAQIVNVTDSHSYFLDEHELEQILMKREVRDLPVVVVSVAGAYRGGKSFLLNFFLRYLTSSQSAQDDGSWLGVDSEPLVGFQWRSGIKRTTTGILMWSEPFVTTLPSGEKVAVLLIDTQGAFDSKSTVRDCSTIFALSTLLSSVQIYNLSQNIQEDDLQHLQLFTEYAKLVKDNNAQKPFQVLEFLVRDWQFPFDHPYGAEGGEQLLNDMFRVTPNLAQELQDLREHIRSSFETVSCFLMPHPGLKVLEIDFSGNIADIDSKFRQQLVDFVRSLFSQEKLLPKTVNGERVKAKDLFQYFKTYMQLFNSDTIPNPTSILKATVEAGLLSAFNDAREMYEKGMDFECGQAEPSVPAVDLQELHKRYVEAAKGFFINKKKMGSMEEENQFLERLKIELKDRLPQFVQMNLAKIQAAVNEANESYEAAIQTIGQDNMLCVHPLDLEKVHNAGLRAALRTFDESRKRLTNKQDDERAQFIQSFEKRYELLRLTNEQTNMMNVSLVHMKYWQKMQSKTGLETRMSEAEFTREHELALQQALEEFISKRNLLSNYTEDVFKTNLSKMIETSFVLLKGLNKSMNSLAVQAAVGQYDAHLSAFENKCLHPNDLEHEHQEGLCRALTAFRPGKKCSDGFDYNDEDEMILYEILRQRNKRIQNLNDYANRSAAQEAFTTYLTSMEDQCRPSLYWLLIYPMVQSMSNRAEFHEKSKAQALNVFFSKRKSGGPGSYTTDPIRDKLVEMMDDAYKKSYLISGAELLPMLYKLAAVAKTYFNSSAAAGEVAAVTVTSYTV